MATLGYAGGAICFAAFALITLYTAQLLADLVSALSSPIARSLLYAAARR
jgi:hypothetical protein